MLEVNISHQQGSFALSLDATLESQAVGVFGESGSGKTTLLHCLAGVLRPQCGRIVFDGDVLCDTEQGIWLPPEKRAIATMFQGARLFPHLSVLQNLMYGQKRLRGREQRFTFDEIVQLLEIDGLLERSVVGLSGGEAQRVALGRALLSEPRLLLLDEPMSGLDRRLKGQVALLIERVRDVLKVPILMVSHDIDEVTRLCDEVILLENGNLAGQGQLGDLIETPQVLTTLLDAGLRNTIEVLPHAVDAGASCQCAALQTGGEALEIYLPNWGLPVGRTVRVAVRPDEIILARKPVEGLSVRNQLGGTVVACAEVNGNTLVQVRLGDATLWVEVTRDAAEAIQLADGEAVTCLIKSNALELVDARL
ncbi:Unannotated [Lentimonas sp. CC19]|uniref:molybdenum ABC transporter ATP-binding protein n=1 Tax=Lentimonas sp. CC19 TaxID=2676097 RepID=UPI00132A3911|nr:molybdenum ABC transporter ATP-binding protein [Lentimonas sp. CC19]CAA6694995.1 Unannotated [Lentimonas sp. CC19]CAA6695362.1 Unannotated [Lentimonas sp. CC10]CAA7072026.1 Unannotated [Lentimonas sp. CC11]